jgi:exonuclease VII small subunit
LLLDEIEKSGDNYEQLRTLTTQLESLEGDLDAALERWFELSAIAETIN